MIFSLEETPDGNVSFELPNTDMFCFFQSEKSVSASRDLWVKAVCTSLKLKRNVLLLERPLPSAPELNFSSRWQVGEYYLLLTPRSLSVFLEASKEFSISYQRIKDFLSSFK
jgi:hypothetical protein